MIPLTDNVFNSLSWEPVDGMSIDKAIEGLTVIGAEPTDYPLTDALTIYFRDRDGAILALDIGADIFNSEPEGNPFYINMARAKPERTERRKRPLKQGTQC